ncbi:tight adherence protein B [Actinacidiphila alni]|uniref:Tight adherence protein B n=1 Tax=Actinacidiphila alni TaxID=380248 RepID=A0A1I2KYL5_9ACTN|nr:type II secretion system F family protein [Actinacidiphila alni]SFF71409.1 tight adherence protein B [Actinacidiphila alni]
MSAVVIHQPSLTWTAVLCAVLAVLAARTRTDPRRRARDLLLGTAPERAGTAGTTTAPGRSHPPSLDRLLETAKSALAAWNTVTAWTARRLMAGRLTGAVRGRLGPEALCLPVGGALALLTASPLPLVAGAAAVPLVGRALRRRRERAAAERGADAVSTLCGTVAGDLRAGRPPHVALADAVEAAGWPASPDLADAARTVLSAARFGGDVPHALREAARLGAGTHGLAAVAACWQVAVDGGAGLAAALDRVAAALRADADQRDDLRAQLAGPRSTAVLLALLPLFGVVLGAGLGADPSKVLLHTPAGLLCLVAGGCLEWAGLAWTARIIRAAEGGAGIGAGAIDRHRKGSAGSAGRKRSAGGAGTQEAADSAGRTGERS